MNQGRFIERLLQALLVSVVGCGVLFSAGCVPKVALPEMLTAPVPQHDANGEYISPYTSDGVMCEWTDKMANVSLASKVGGTIAAVAAQQALKQVPFVGGLLGMAADRIGNAVGRKIAIESVGGWDYIKSKTDQSFVTLEDLAVHMYACYCYNEHYQASLGALMELYPELKRDNKYNQILVEASKDICNDNPKCVKITELPGICGTGKQIAQKSSQDVPSAPTPAAAEQLKEVPVAPEPAAQDAAKPAETQEAPAKK